LISAEYASTVSIGSCRYSGRLYEELELPLYERDDDELEERYDDELDEDDER
jgi:hypothetical protein